MAASTATILERVGRRERLDEQEALELAGHDDLRALMAAARHLRDSAHASIVSYSPKVFIPLTKLCRDVCHYCTFAGAPSRSRSAYLSMEEVLSIARTGAAAGCREALFTLGDKPELRYRVAREALAARGYLTTVDYLEDAARRVHEETGLLPHLNPGLMSAEDLARLRRVSVSSGIMLESVSQRLCERGGPHFGSPDKQPAERLRTLREAGRQRIPFTSGILVGIGETRRERIESLLALRRIHDEFGHLQEVIVQNFRAKPGTRMANAPEPSIEEHLWTIAVARLIFGAQMSLQAPPNLRPDSLATLVDAGINDWGGVSPVTPDHVNPEAPWPALDVLAQATERAGKTLVPRLAIYPRYVLAPTRWVHERLRPSVLRHADAEGFARDSDWLTGDGSGRPPPPRAAPRTPPEVAGELRLVLERASAGDDLDEAAVVRLLRARGSEFEVVCDEADRLRESVNADVVSYVVNRNINYTNVCYFRCRFCAFSKGRSHESLRGRPYEVSLNEIARRTEEAWARGATEVCMQGGIHPSYTGETYLEILRAAKSAAPRIHVHAFSPLEVWHGAQTLDMTVHEFLRTLREAGLGSLPGTAAEVLDDEVRRIICPDKIDTRRWLEIVEIAHEVGLRTTATIMFGHVEGLAHQARHLLRIRQLQARTGGFTEFVPLPFVAAQAPIYRRGQSRRGPTYREAVLMHAVARLVLHPHVTNIQTSWVKMGLPGVLRCLEAGANDVGGTLMNESITRAAGAEHGQEQPPATLEALVRSLARRARQRTTLYADASPERRRAAARAQPLADVLEAPARRFRREHDGALARPETA